jgi:hypothetical protein
MKVGLAVVLAVSLAACVDDDLVVDSDQAELLTLNSLLPEDYWGNQTHVQNMLRGVLKTTSTTTYMVSDPNRVKVMQYLARCALKAGQAAAITASNGVPVKLYGALGLAPTWISSPPTVEGRAWVTACMALHLNAFGAPVSISMRSWLKPFDQPTDAEKSYGCDEAAFYPGPDGQHACWGDCMQEFCSNPDATLLLRECGSSPQCGLTIDGPCSKVCARQVDGHWEDCNGAAPVFTSVLESGKDFQCVVD